MLMAGVIIAFIVVPVGEKARCSSAVWTIANAFAIIILFITIRGPECPVPGQPARPSPSDRNKTSS